MLHRRGHDKAAPSGCCAASSTASSHGTCPTKSARCTIYAFDDSVRRCRISTVLRRCASPRLAAQAAVAQPFDRLVIELLSRTGMRVGELCDLAADAVVIWTRRRESAGPGRETPQRPLRPTTSERPTAPRRLDHRTSTCRRIPLAPQRPTTRPPSRRTDRSKRHASRRSRARSPRRTPTHPRDPSINQWASAPRVNATMLGHRSMRITLTYARIANNTVADEYAIASAKIDALYTSNELDQRLRQLAGEHRRILGNCSCNRPSFPACVSRRSRWRSAVTDPTRVIPADLVLR